MAFAFRRSIAWRLAPVALAALYACACVGSGLDRMSAGNPALQRLVPAPFRAEAEIAQATLALSGEAPTAAADMARLAVSADPVNRRPVALLGMQRLLADDFAGAEAAFRVGAQLGWREPLTQGYWYRAALLANDPRRAAERLDALLRADPGLPGMEVMLQPLLATPEGRTALAERLAYRPEWLARFLAPPAGTDGRALVWRASVIGLLPDRLGCAQVEPLAARLARAGQHDALQSLRARQCGGASEAGLLADPAFAELGRSGGAAGGWRLHPSGDVSAVAEGSGPNRAVTASNLASVRRPILSQQVALPAGTYRVLLSAEPARAQSLIAAALSCGEGRAYPALDNPLAVTAGDCPSQTFTLWLAPSRDDVRIRSIRLEPGR
jgi:hypothetical protein